MTDRPVCLECGAGSGARLVKGSELFAGERGSEQRRRNLPALKRHRWWVCRCGAFVRARSDGKPLGHMAGPELRTYRARGHDLIDRAVRRARDVAPEPLARALVYIWLADRLGLALSATHFGLFDLHHARRAEGLLRLRADELDAYLRRAEQTCGAYMAREAPDDGAEIEQAGRR